MPQPTRTQSYAFLESRGKEAERAGSEISIRALTFSFLFLFSLQTNIYDSGCFIILYYAQKRLYCIVENEGSALYICV